MHAVLCGAGHKLCMILARLQVLDCAFIGPLALALMLVTPASRPALTLHAR
jgi:hypothetical protein